MLCRARMRKGIGAATGGEYPRRVAQRESVPFIRERSSLTRTSRGFGRPGALLSCRQIFGARPARSNTGVFSMLSGAAPEGVSSAARRNDSAVASSPSTVSLAALPESCGRPGTCWVPSVPGLFCAIVLSPCMKRRRPAEAGRLCQLRIGVARLVVRLFGIFATFCGSLALLARFLTAALLRGGLLPRRLILLARLVLVRHVCFLSWDRKYNLPGFGFVPIK